MHAAGNPCPYLCTAPSGPRLALLAALLRRCALRARLCAGGAALAPPRDVTLAAGPPGEAAALGALGPGPRPACRPHRATATTRVPAHPRSLPSPPLGSAFTFGPLRRREGTRPGRAHTLGGGSGERRLGRAYGSCSSNCRDANPLHGGGD